MRKGLLWIVLAGVGLLLLGFYFDAPINRSVASHRIPACEVAAKLCSHYSAWPWLMLLAAIALLIAWVRRHRDWLRLLCLMMIAASLAGLSADLLRGVTGRTRPYAQVPQGFYGVHDGAQWLITKHAYNSFPSGHTATITAFLLPLVFWRRHILWLAVPVICMVGAARVYVGAHHLSDIIAGTLLGTVIALSVQARAAPFLRAQ